MTIKRLSEFLKEQNVPIMGRRSHNDNTPSFYLSDLKGKRIAIEIAGIIYKMNWAAVKYVINSFPFSYITDRWNRPCDNEIYDMFAKYFESFINRIIGTGIIPVFVMEGKAPPMKTNTIQKRTDTKNDQVEKATTTSQILDLQDYKKSLLYSYPPSSRHADIALDVLKDKGCIVIRSRYEAEGVCAYLVNTHTIVDSNGITRLFPYHCDAALCDDYDILGLYGCRAVIRNLRSIGNDRSQFEVEGHTIDDILYSIGFLDRTHTDEQRLLATKRFQLMCILCGSDYSDNIRGFGPSKICSMMKKHNIHTFEDACKVDNRFSQIPYDDIIRTIDDNASFTIHNYT